MAEDVNQAALLAYNLRNMNEHDIAMVRRIMENNWEDQEQMVSNLLQFPFFIPDDIRTDYLIKGLNDNEHPYYVLSSIIGLQKIPVKDGDWKLVFDGLKSAAGDDQGVIAMRAFMVLQPRLKHPSDTSFVVSLMRSHKSPLFQNAITWLVLNVKEKKEILNILNDSGISKQAKENGEKKIMEHFERVECGEFYVFL